MWKTAGASGSRRRASISNCDIYNESCYIVDRQTASSVQRFTTPYAYEAPRSQRFLKPIPGQAISPHRHPHSDEILFIYGGTGLASLAGRQAVVASGATVYMPRNTVVG